MLDSVPPQVTFQNTHIQISFTDTTGVQPLWRVTSSVHTHHREKRETPIVIRVWVLLDSNQLSPVSNKEVIQAS